VGRSRGVKTRASKVCRRGGARCADAGDQGVKTRVIKYQDPIGGYRLSINGNVKVKTDLCFVKKVQQILIDSNI